MKLNLGCGRDLLPDHVNIDRAEIPCDLRCDFRFPLPFVNGSFASIYSSGVLEQIGPNEQFVKLMNELHRVLVAEGILTVIVPDAHFPIAFRDPFDCRHFIPETWDYLDSRDRLWISYGNHYGFLPWNVLYRSVNHNGVMTVGLRKVSAC